MPMNSGTFLSGSRNHYSFICPCGYTTREYQHKKFTEKLLKLHTSKCEICQKSKIDSYDEITKTFRDL